MRATTHIVTLACALLWTGAPSLPAQVEPDRPERPPAFEEEIQVTEVLIDALVTDERGNAVLGLGEDDFIVEEDGEPMDVDHVTFYSNRRFIESAERAERIGIDPADVPTERYFILFFHDQRDILPRITAQLLSAGQRAKQWVRGELLPNDHVAVVSYRHKLRIYQDFTADEERIGNAIDQAVRGVDPERWPSRMEAAEGPSLLANLPSPEAVSRSSERFYGAMEILAQAAGAVPARKNLVLFSLGYGEVHEFGFYTPDSRYYQPMIRELNDNNVAVYSIDLIAIEPGQQLIDNVYANSLSQLSSDTGGAYYFNFVNFRTPLERMAEETSGYYLLSYTSRHPEGTSGYQKVEVRTTNPTFDVDARQGYQWGDEDEGGRR